MGSQLMALTLIIPVTLSAQNNCFLVATENFAEAIVGSRFLNLAAA